MQQQGYVPGKGFNDGWADRMAGRASRLTMDANNNYNPYWSEYHHGYSEANTRVIEDAKRKQMNESRSFLTENPAVEFKKMMDRMGE